VPTAAATNVTVTGEVEPGANSNKWYNTWAFYRGVSARGNPDDGTFSLPGVPLYPGTNVLVARLRDVSGNEAEQTRKVVRTNALETFEYDGKGNLANWVSWVQNWSYERDWADRLVKVESRPGTPQGSWRRVEWQYDALGRRIRQTTSTWLVQSNLWVVTEDLKFLSDPLLFGRHLVDLDASNNVPVRTYVWGLDLSERMDGAGGVVGLLWVTLHTASGPAAGTHFAAYDGNGNVVALSAATDGSPTARYEYGPFGEPIRVTGPAAALNPFRFSTKRTDPTTDLVLYEYRAYSPTSGRWLNRDPIEESGGRNLYGFVYNNPIRRIDRLGLFVETCPGALKAIAASSGMRRLRRDSQKASANKSAHFVAAIPVKAESACDVWRRTKEETDCSLCCEEVYAKYANRCSWRKKPGWLAWRNACLSTCAKSDGERGPDLPGPNRVPPILP